MGKVSLLSRRKGYTLIEMVLVVTLISILATGLIIGYGKVTNRSKDAGVDINLKSINTSVDYLKERNDYLPNLKQLQNELGMQSYKFVLDRALISKVDGDTLLSIRAITTELSKYNEPYSISMVVEYDGSMGTYSDGDFINISTYEAELKNYPSDLIRMIVIDNAPSGVPEIIWFN